jgi:hypothetical protein
VRIVTREELAEYRALFHGSAETLIVDADARVTGSRNVRIDDSRIAACDPSQSAWVSIVRSGVRYHWRWLPFAEVWIEAVAQRCAQ